VFIGKEGQVIKLYQSKPILFVSTYYIDNVVNLIDSLNGKGNELLRQAKISKENTQNLADKISLKQYLRLLKSTESVSEQASIGILLAQNVNITGHGNLGFAVMSSPNIGIAIDLIAKYISLLSPLMSIKVVNTAAKVKIQFHESSLLGHANRIYIDMVTCTTISVLRFISATNIQASQVCFNFKPPHYLKLYQQVFNCPIKYEQTLNEIILPNEIISYKTRTADLLAFKQYREQCQFELEQQLLDVSQLIKQLLRSTKGEFPTLEQIAFKLNTTARTLRRHLKSYHTNYSEIVDQVRYELSKNYLKDKSLSVSQIALLLGYKEQANFSKRFKQWQGITPTAYRNLLYKFN